MPEFLHFDPVTGTRKLFDWDESTNSVVITTEQDVSAVLKAAAEEANTGKRDAGIKRSLWHYCYLPAVVQLELRKKGIDIYSQDPAMQRRFFNEMNTTYKRFKTTHKTHA